MLKLRLKSIVKRMPFVSRLIAVKRRFEWPRRFFPRGGSSFRDTCQSIIGEGAINLPLADEEGAWYTKQPLIWAHAGGALHIIVPNTKEAIDNSIRRGFSVIEVDVSVTIDGIAVLSHNFSPNYTKAFNGIPTYAQFISTTVCGRHTPLSLSDLWEQEEYKEWHGFFALDQTASSCRPHFNLISYLKKRAPVSFLRTKVIYLACSFEELKELQSENPFAAIHFCLFACPPISLVNTLIKVFAATNVHSVSFCDTEITDDIAKVINAFSEANIYVSISGVDTIERLKSWLAIGAKCINTNYLTPLDIEGE